MTPLPNAHGKNKKALPLQETPLSTEAPRYQQPPRDLAERIVAEGVLIRNPAARKAAGCSSAWSTKLAGRKPLDNRNPRAISQVRRVAVSMGLRSPQQNKEVMMLWTRN